MVRSPRKAISVKDPKKEVAKTGITNRRIEVRIGMTVNLGNYESHRIDMGFTGDIRDDEELETKYDEIINWVEDKMSAEVELIKTGKNVLDKISRGKKVR